MWQRGAHAAQQTLLAESGTRVHPFPSGPDFRNLWRAAGALPVCPRSSGRWSAPWTSWPNRASSRWVARHSSACGGSTCCTPCGPAWAKKNKKTMATVVKTPGNETSAGTLRGGAVPVTLLVKVYQTVMIILKFLFKMSIGSQLVLFLTLYNSDLL